MTIEKLTSILRVNDIPLDTRIVSDSGWECYATECDGVYYCDELKCVVLKQEYSKFDEYSYISNKKYKLRPLKEEENA